MAVQEYGAGEYWDKRYAQAGQTTFDWYCGWDDTMEALFGRFCTRDSPIHLPGCGNGTLSESLVRGRGRMRGEGHRTASPSSFATTGAYGSAHRSTEWLHHAAELSLAAVGPF